MAVTVKRSSIIWKILASVIRNFDTETYAKFVKRNSFFKDTKKKNLT